MISKSENVLKSNNWSKKKIIDILKLEYGKGLTKSERINGAYPVYGSGGIIGLHNKSLINTFGLIVGRKGSIGTIYFSKKPFFPIDTVYYITNQNYKELQFIYYFLQAIGLEKLNSDAAVPGLNRNWIHSLDTIYPIQKLRFKIAAVLSAYDDLIENNNRRIAILEKMAEEIYKEWFVRMRFPNHENTKFVKGVPEGWEVIDLGYKIKFERGKNLTLNETISGKIPVVSAGIKPTSFHNKYNVEAPVITISSSGANAGYINLYLENIWASDCSFLNKKNQPNIFYYYCLVKAMQKNITLLQRGAAQPHVYPKDIARLKIYNSDLKIISKFEKIAEMVFEQIQNLKNKNQILNQTRDRLLPRLISGKLSVEELNIKFPKSMEE